MQKVNLREVLRASIRSLPEEIVVATSGGVDSSSLVFAALDEGKKVRIASFTVSGRTSSDFAAAKRLASTLSLPFLPVELPTDPDAICADLRLIIRRYKARKKTSVECLWPFLYVLREMQKNDLRTLVTGSAADGHFALSKKAMIHHRYPRAKFQAFRRAYFAQEDPAQVKTLARIGKDFDVSVRAPYVSKELLSLWSHLTWDEMNKPKQKQPIRSAFPELAPLSLANHSNLQLGDSGIAELVGSVAISRYAYGARSPVSAYNALAR